MAVKGVGNGQRKGNRLTREGIVSEGTAETLELLPEEMREPAVAYILEQAEKFKVLKHEVERCVASADAGRVREWNFADILRRAKLSDVDSRVGGAFFFQRAPIPIC